MCARRTFENALAGARAIEQLKHAEEMLQDELLSSRGILFIVMLASMLRCECMRQKACLSRALFIILHHVLLGDPVFWDAHAVGYLSLDPFEKYYFL